MQQDPELVLPADHVAAGAVAPCSLLTAPLDLPPASAPQARAGAQILRPFSLQLVLASAASSPCAGGSGSSSRNASSAAFRCCLGY